MNKFLLLLDYKKRFLISVEDLHNYSSMNIEKICLYLTKHGYSVEKCCYSELDFNKTYKGYHVLYQTSEDVGLFYKNYIEDIIYALEMQGANLLPKFKYLRAHHNKNFMELIRNNFKYEGFKTINSKLFGTAEEAIKLIDKFPVVIKSSEGSGSRKVTLASNRLDFEKKVKDISGVFIVNNFKSVKEFIVYITCLKLINKVQTLYRSHTFYRHKFIVQNFIESLIGDYKVIYMGGKYYTLFRLNRENDFRASGSGEFFPVDDTKIKGLLDYAKKLTQEIEFPIIGMDIGFDGQKYHLFEFQCIHIGPYTLHASE